MQAYTLSLFLAWQFQGNHTVSPVLMLASCSDHHMACASHLGQSKGLRVCCRLLMTGMLQVVTMLVQRHQGMWSMARIPQKHPLPQLQSLGAFLVFRQAQLRPLARMWLREYFTQHAGGRKAWLAALACSLLVRAASDMRQCGTCQSAELLPTVMTTVSRPVLKASWW